MMHVNSVARGGWLRKSLPAFPLISYILSLKPFSSGLEAPRAGPGCQDALDSGWPESGHRSDKIEALCSPVGGGLGRGDTGSCRLRHGSNSHVRSPPLLHLWPLQLRVHLAPGPRDHHLHEAALVGDRPPGAAAAAAAQGQELEWPSQVLSALSTLITWLGRQTLKTQFQ